MTRVARHNCLNMLGTLFEKNAAHWCLDGKSRKAAHVGVAKPSKFGIIMCFACCICVIHAFKFLIKVRVRAQR